MKNYGNNKVAERDNGSDDLKTKKKSQSKGAPDALSNHLPFWSGMGLCYGGKDPSTGCNLYPPKILTFELPAKKERENPPKPESQTETPVDEEKPPVNEMGTPVTRSAANAMVKDFYENFKSQLNRRFNFATSTLTEEQLDEEILSLFEETLPYCVLFGKDALLSMLSQGGCEGIRYYFCLNPKGKPSLVFVAAQANHDDFGGGSNGSIIDTSPPTSDEPEPDTATKPGRVLASQKTPTVEVGGTDPPRQLKAVNIYGSGNSSK